MFRALVLDKADGQVTSEVKTLNEAGLPDGDVTVSVAYSTLNWKDGAIIKGTLPLVRHYPHVPGVDFAGTVEASDNPDFQPGELMILRDHINLLGNPLLGPNEEGLGERFPDMSTAYDPALREIAARACASAGVTAHEGVYIAVTGPSYETPAEIRMARTLGADAVGMSTVPEVIAARHMGIRVLTLSCLTNMAAGVIDRPLDHADVLRVAERLRSTLLDVLTGIVKDIAETS